MLIPLIPSALSMISEAPTNAIDKEMIVPKTPVRIRMLLMKRGRLKRVLSVATSVEASAL